MIEPWVKFFHSGDPDVIRQADLQVPDIQGASLARDIMVIANKSLKPISLYSILRSLYYSMRSKPRILLGPILHASRRTANWAMLHP